MNVCFIAQCFEQYVRRFPQFMGGRDIFGGLKSEIHGQDAGGPVNGIIDGEMTPAERSFMIHYDKFSREGIFGDLSDRTSTDRINLVHCKTRIPDALLTGPWDEESLRKLYWVLCAGACYQDDQTWELQFQGIETALDHLSVSKSQAVSAMAMLRHTIDWLDWPASGLEDIRRLFGGYDTPFSVSDLWQTQ